MPDTVKPLNQYCVSLLGGLFTGGEWYENPGQLYRAGEIMGNVLPDVPPEPRLLRKFTAAGYPVDPSNEEVEAHRATHKTWATTVAPWRREPTPKEVKAIEACVKKFSEQKKLGGSIYLLPLLNLAALKPED